MDDIYYNILLNLDIVDIGICGNIDKTFNNVFKLEMLWKNVYFINFSDCYISGTYYDTCKRYYCLLKLYKFDNIFGINISKMVDIYYYVDRKNYPIIPTEIALLKNAWFMSITKGSVNFIPTELALLSNLKMLILNNNLIESIPLELFNLPKLEALELSHNCIKIIPPQISLLSNLKQLKLDNNKIKIIPTTIGLMTELYLLHLNNNRISVLPTELLLLTKLYDDVKYINGGVAKLKVIQ